MRRYVIVTERCELIGWTCEVFLPLASPRRGRCSCLQPLTPGDATVFYRTMLRSL